MFITVVFTKNVVKKKSKTSKHLLGGISEVCCFQGPVVHTSYTSYILSFRTENPHGKDLPGAVKRIAKVKNDPQTPASISIPVGLPQSGGSCGLPSTLGTTHHQSSHSHGGGLATPNTTVGIGTPVAAQSSVRLGCSYFRQIFL